LHNYGVLPTTGILQMTRKCYLNTPNWHVRSIGVVRKDVVIFKNAISWRIK